MPKLIGEIVQSGGNFALLDSSNLRGGFMQVSTIEERDNIVEDKKKIGMFVYVDETLKIYQLKDSGWILLLLRNEDRFLTRYASVQEVIEEERYYKILLDDMPFVGNDLIGWNIDEELNGTYSQVLYVSNGYIFVNKNVTPPDKYTTIYLVGNALDRMRLCVVVQHKLHGSIVLSLFYNDSLDTINTNCVFRLGHDAEYFYKVYGKDVYFRGTFISNTGTDIGNLVASNTKAILKGFYYTQNILNLDNLLNNPFFMNGLEYWVTSTTGKYFRLGNSIYSKYIAKGTRFLTTSTSGAFVHYEDELPVLVIRNGHIILRRDNFRQILDLNNEPWPKWVTLMFNFKPLTAGTLKVGFLDHDAYTIEADLEPNEEYTMLKKSFIWNGEGDFRMEYNGDIKILSILFKVDDVKNLISKYHNVL